MSEKMITISKSDLRSMIGEGFHTAFRKGTDCPEAMQIHRLISDMAGDEWRNVLDFVMSGFDDGFDTPPPVLWAAVEVEYDQPDTVFDHYITREAAQAECLRVFSRNANWNPEYLEGSAERKVMAQLGYPCKPVDKYDLNRVEWGTDGRMSVWSNVRNAMFRTSFEVYKVEGAGA